MFLTPKGRLLKRELVPLAEEVNAVAVRGVRKADIATTRAVLLAIIENLARDEPRRTSACPRRARWRGLGTRRKPGHLRDRRGRVGFASHFKGNPAVDLSALSALHQAP